MGEIVVKSSLENPREVDKLLRQEQWGAISSLKEKGVSKKEIARSLGIAVQTVRKYIRRRRWEPYRRQVTVVTKVDPYKPYLMKRMSEVDYCARILFDEIKEQGYTGGYEMVKLFVRPHRQAQRNLEAATIRFETAPGKQSQADWSSVKVWINNVLVRTQLFVMTLGYSRGTYAVCKPDQKLPALIDCHIRAWDHFGGRTEEILYDNPKTIVLSRDYDGKNITWNAQFLDFTRYYGYEARLCRPYRARTKGKVESGVKYVKNNFFKRYRHFTSWDDLNEKLIQWCTGTADNRIHGTTHRRPVEARKEERLICTASKPPYMIEVPIRRKVPNDCLVNFKANRYSVPFTYIGKRVDIVSAGNEVKMYHGGMLIASHALSGGKFNVFMDQGHYKGLFRLHGNDKRPQADDLVMPMHNRQPDVQVRDLAYYEALAGGTIS